MARSDNFSATIAAINQRAAAVQSERRAVATSLRKVISEAQSMLHELGEDVAAAVKRGRPVGSKTNRSPAKKKRGRPKGSKLSAAARKKISMAQKKRWAKSKAADRKQSS
jgi:hypothetical protein